MLKFANFESFFKILVSVNLQFHHRVVKLVAIIWNFSGSKILDLSLCTLVTNLGRRRRKLEADTLAHSFKEAWLQKCLCCYILVPICNQFSLIKPDSMH